MTSMTTPGAPSPAADEPSLIHCEHCGRYGWHSTERCPNPSDVAPPAGAEADIWEGPPLRRVVFTVPTVVLNNTGDPFRSPIVTAQAIQFADGSLDVEGVIEAPSISIESAGDTGLTVDQARELAAAIVDAADVIDGWVK